MDTHRRSGYGDGGYGDGATISQSPRLGSSYRALSAEDIIKSMDAMWSERNDEVLALEKQHIHFPEFEGALLTELFKHQLVAVSWMKDRENVKSKELPHFYKKTRSGNTSMRSLDMNMTQHQIILKEGS